MNVASATEQVGQMKTKNTKINFLKKEDRWIEQKCVRLYINFCNNTHTEHDDPIMRRRSHKIHQEAEVAITVLSQKYSTLSLL